MCLLMQRDATLNIVGALGYLSVNLDPLEHSWGVSSRRSFASPAVFYGS